MFAILLSRAKKQRQQNKKDVFLIHICKATVCSKGDELWMGGGLSEGIPSMDGSEERHFGAIRRLSGRAISNNNGQP